jgi:signal transduction histidine kinase
VTTLLAYAAREAKVGLDLQCHASPVLAHGVPSRVNQAITNLVQNAIDASAETGRGGRVVVRVSSDNGSAVVRVEDDGPGIPDTVLPRVFEPLFTTKPYGKGTGLGLAIVNEIVRDELGGRISIETNVGKGTAFVVSFPESGDSHGA